jgi:hypothetical protein
MNANLERYCDRTQATVHKQESKFLLCAPVGVTTGFIANGAPFPEHNANRSRLASEEERRREAATTSLNAIVMFTARNSILTSTTVVEKFP